MAAKPKSKRGGKRPGAGRPRAGNHPKLLNLKPETIALIEVLARREGLTQSQLVDGLVARAARRSRTPLAL